MSEDFFQMYDRHVSYTTIHSTYLLARISRGIFFPYAMQESAAGIARIIIVSHFETEEGVKEKRIK